MILYDQRSRWFRRLVTEETRRYMLRATVRQAALYNSTRKRRVRSAMRAHAGVKCPHAGIAVGRLQKGQPASAVTLTSGRVRSADLLRETFTFPLICTVQIHTVIDCILMVVQYGIHQCLESTLIYVFLDFSEHAATP